MLKAISIPLILVSWTALAQTPIKPPAGAPVVTLAPEDKPIVMESIAKLTATLLSPPTGMPADPSAAARLRDVEHNVEFSDTIDLRNVPFLGMALSRNSQDPKACALLKRIEPSAMCVK